MVIAELPASEARPKKPWISSDTWGLMRQRAAALVDGDVEAAGGLTRQIRAAATRGRKRWTVDSIDAAVGARDRWVALKQHRKAWGPRPYERCDRHGGRLRAAEMAIWSTSSGGNNRGRSSPPPARGGTQISDAGAGCLTGRITREGVQAAIRRQKAQNATGPDEIPAEALKILVGPLEGELAHLFAGWYDGTGDMAGVTDAAVVLLFQKGQG